MKYAQFKDPKLPTLITVVGRDDDDLDRPFCNDIRISEWVEIEFPPLPLSVTVPAQIAALDREAKTLKQEFAERLHEIAERKASLLALTHEGQS